MPDSYTGKERREFLRHRHEGPVKFKEIISPKNKDTVSNLFDAISKNLSASGILFSSKHIPELSSVIALDIDYHTSRLCEEIESRALIIDNKLFGKVVRIEDDDGGMYDIGVAFITKSETLPKAIESLIK